MKFKTLSLAIVSAVAASAFLCCCNPVKIDGVEQTADNQLKVTTADNREITVTFVTDDIVKVDNLEPGQVAQPSRASVLEGETFKGKAPKLTAEGDLAVFTSALGVQVRINPQTGELKISDGTNWLADNGSRSQLNDSVRVMALESSSGRWYGAGERGHRGYFQGDTLVNYNRQNYGYTGDDQRISQMNITMPLLLSPDGFAVLFDDYAASSMTTTDKVVYTSEAPEAVSYYFVAGKDKDLSSLTTSLTSLTGRQPLPALWTLGYITSRYGYKTPQEALGAIDSLKSRGYPVDGIVFDLYWYGKEQDMGRLAWDPQIWGDHHQMLDSLKNMGVNTTLISQPYILRNGEGLDNYNTLKEQGLMVMNPEDDAQEVVIWVGEGGMFDVSNPATRQWLSQRYKDLTVDGNGALTGWWGDLGEPEVHPLTGRHANGLTTRQYHNQYGNDWSEIVYDMFTENFPQVRPMIMMRGGTTGLQRYSVFPWSTDVSRSWGGLQPQITIMKNAGLSGLGYMGHDVGGFAIDQANPIDPELYVRWIQLGLFSPMLRTHAQQYAEPYNYPQYQDIILPLIKERYQWLPYNYTLAYENAQYGYPLVRPLNFNLAGNTSYDDIADEYLWGNDLLVAPVLTQGTTQRDVVLPEGSQWYDYANPTQIFNGGTTISYGAPLDMLPRFVRAGAFIPQADYPMENVGDYRRDIYNVSYYPAPDGTSTKGSIFEDSLTGNTTLQDSQYVLINFNGSQKADGQVDMTVSTKGSYRGAPEQRTLNMVVYNVSSECNQVFVDGKKVDSSYNAEQKSVSFNLTLGKGNVKVQIKK